MLKNPFFRNNVIPSAIFEPFRPRKFQEGKAQGVEDESVGDFVERRFGKSVADVLIGALCPGLKLLHCLSVYNYPLTTHSLTIFYYLGIYSTNARALSVRSCFPSLFSLEKKYGSVIGGLVGGWVSSLRGKREPKEEIMERERVKREKDGRVKSGVYSFKGGMETVVNSLSSSLSQSPTISLLLSSPVRKVEVRENGKVGVVFGEKSEKRMDFDHVFSALPLDVLGESLPPSHSELGL